MSLIAEKKRAGHRSAGRRFRIGTTGWTASDLENPAIEREWFKGNFEIVEGVLTEMPPAYFDGGFAMGNLLAVLYAYSRSRGLKWKGSFEVDIVVDEIRVPRADRVIMSPAEKSRQDRTARNEGKSDPKRTRILVPPLIVIESVSPGHELHDRRTKRRWYAEFGVPNYWILDAFGQTLECLRRRGRKFVSDARGEASQVVKPSAFPGLSIELADLWGED